MCYKKPRWADTPLHCACLAANYDVIELLLAQYPTAPVGERNVNGKLPIQILLKHDEPENDGYMLSSIFLLLSANPEMWMDDMNLVLALTSRLVALLSSSIRIFR